MQTVKVRLRKPNRVLTFLSREVPLKRNDPCIVRSDRGLEYGICVVPPEDCGPEEEERYKMTVVRKATDYDNVTHVQIQDDERRAKELCARKIRERGLPMKLADVEYAFDRRKVTFYFTAEERVDFRELVRDLAHELKTRIELRHIQVRDEAKLLGGIGTCGRELCCTTWLQEFMPISMKMAKRQNLSLNPSKISGQCGRLMCCLAYENEMYAREKRAQAPYFDYDADDLAAKRDRMEANAPEAARMLKRTTLRDVAGDEDLEPESAESDADYADWTNDQWETGAKAPEQAPPDGEARSTEEAEVEVEVAVSGPIETDLDDEEPLDDTGVFVAETQQETAEATESSTVEHPGVQTGPPGSSAAETERKERPGHAKRRRRRGRRRHSGRRDGGENRERNPGP